jgi:PEP-CTERM/exosortase A-associated glycosyltransferase
MRILHILDHSLPLHSGYTFRTINILREQRRLGWDTVHITSTRQHSGDRLQDQVDEWLFYRTPFFKGTTRKTILEPVWSMRALHQRLVQLVQQLKPDILHAHSPVLNALPALWVGRRYKIPVVYEIRAFWEDAAVDHGVQPAWGWRYRITRALETYAAQHADQVVTICQGLRQELMTRGVAATRLHVVPNAVDIDQFQAATAQDTRELRNQLGLTDGCVLGFIGSFYAYEGLELLIQAVPSILQQYPQARILLVGGGPQEAALKTLTANLGLENHVLFTGRVPHDQVTTYYNLIDVLVYPRHAIRLTELVTPLKPLEAMAQGRLVLASDIGGHRELIRPDQTGLLFPADDVAALAAAACAALGLPDHGRLLRQQARSFVEHERNWTLSVSNYKMIYNASRSMVRTVF